jgi:tetratricopeptide (TPR) repeat protein
MKTKSIDTGLEKNNKLTRQILFVIFVFTLLLYSNSIKNNYALDDNYVTAPKGEVGNTRVAKGFKGIPEIFKSHFVESVEQSFEYRPLPLVTFAIEYQFFGSNPHISHFIDVLLYALTCMLLFVILLKLFKEYHIIFPLFATFLFIIHPIHTEVVDNIKCRDELLSFLFGLCATYFFIRSQEVENKSRKFNFLMILFLFFGLLCKQTAILFMFLIPVTSYFFYDFKLKKVLYYGLAALLVYMVYKLFKRSMIHELKTVRGFSFFENPLYFEHDFLIRIPMALNTLGCYLKLLIFPYPLSCYYGYNTIQIAAWRSPMIYVALLFYSSLGIYALIQLPKKNAVSYASLIFLLGILPFANLYKPVVGIVGERFVYFASLGFCILGSYALLRFLKIDIKKGTKFKFQETKPSFKLILSGIFLLYGGLVVSRNTDWKDKLTLYCSDAEHREDSYLLQKLAAFALYEHASDKGGINNKNAMLSEAQNRIKRAADLLEEGLVRYNQDYSSITTLGTFYSNYLNNVDKASLLFKKALAINPTDDATRYNFILCYEKKNLPDSAILLYKKMADVGTKYPPVYIQLHELYLQKQDYINAIMYDEKAINNCPGPYLVKGYVNLGNAYMLNKDTLNAIKSFENAVKLEPGFVNLKAQVDAFKRSTGYTKTFNRN